jgi:hypothetical protein
MCSTYMVNSFTTDQQGFVNIIMAGIPHPIIFLVKKGFENRWDRVTWRTSTWLLKPGKKHGLAPALSGCRLCFGTGPKLCCIERRGCLKHSRVQSVNETKKRPRPTTTPPRPTIMFGTPFRAAIYQALKDLKALGYIRFIVSCILGNR